MIEFFCSAAIPSGAALAAAIVGDRRNPLRHRRPPNGLLIEECILPVRRVDDQLDPVALDLVHHVRSSLLHLVHAIHAHPDGRKHVAVPSVATI